MSGAFPQRDVQGLRTGGLRIGWLDCKDRATLQIQLQSISIHMQLGALECGANRVKGAQKIDRNRRVILRQSCGLDQFLATAQGLLRLARNGWRLRRLTAYKGVRESKNNAADGRGSGVLFLPSSIYRCGASAPCRRMPAGSGSGARTCRKG